jgi:hypothetical protein
VEYLAPSTAIKRLDAQIRRLVRTSDIDRGQREAIQQLLQVLNNARIYAQDYELSETREEQLENAKKAQKWLKKALAGIVGASQLDIFSAIDVAHLSAQMEQVKESLR